MKKNIAIALATIISSSMVSCSMGVKSDIISLSNEEIRHLKVEKIEVDSAFYRYTDEYIAAAEKTDSLYDIYRYYMDKVADEYENASYYMKRITEWLGIGSSLSDDYMKMSDDHRLSAEDYKIKADSIKNIWKEQSKITDKIEAKYEKGTIYAVRYTGKNKYGKWNNFHSYDIYTYDTDGNIHTYNGEEAADIISSMYDVSKDILSVIKDNASSLMTTILADIL